MTGREASPPAVAAAVTSQEDAAELGQVRVTLYRRRRVERAVGAANSVDTDDIAWWGNGKVDT